MSLKCRAGEPPKQVLAAPKQSTAVRGQAHAAPTSEEKNNLLPIHLFGIYKRNCKYIVHI